MVVKCSIDFLDFESPLKLCEDYLKQSAIIGQ